jgi:hypothetical protein
MWIYWEVENVISFSQPSSNFFFQLGISFFFISPTFGRYGIIMTITFPIYTLPVVADFTSINR